MKVSDAIRIGSTLRPQVKGDLRKMTSTGEYGSCALGAAFEAQGCKVESQIVDCDREAFRGPVVKAGQSVLTTIVPEFWVKLLNKTRGCPECGMYTGLRRLIPHLNDEHEWSRSRIADFVATCEPKKRVLKQAIVTDPQSVVD